MLAASQAPLRVPERGISGRSSGRGKDTEPQREEDMERGGEEEEGGVRRMHRAFDTLLK